MGKFRLSLVATAIILILLLAVQFNTSWQVSKKYYGGRDDDNNLLYLPSQEEDDDDNNNNISYPPQQSSRSKLHPRTISIIYAKDHWNSRRQPTTMRHGDIMSVPYTKEFKYNSVPSNPAFIQPNWYQPNAAEYIDNSNNCEPMYNWQLQSFPNCNKFHELDLSTMRFINSGGSRSAFELREDINGYTEKFVYKSIKYYRDVTMKQAEEQRKDGLLLERMSSSPFIPSSHGYCSVAVIMDFMPEGSMHDYIKGVRLAGGSTLSPLDRLRIVIHIAGSVAALHTIDGTEQPSFFHNDLCCHQYLFQNGIFKLNDFNYARPIFINKETNERCTRRSFGMAMWTARSLEEHMLAVGAPIEDGGVKPDKIDVWMMGNIMFIIMTDLYTFEKPENLKWQVAGEKMINGERTEIPEYIRNSTDPSYVAMQKALDMCWTQSWKERPSAKSVNDYLMGELRKITGEENPDLRVTLPERDPNQRNTESDYNDHND